MIPEGHTIEEAEEKGLLADQKWIYQLQKPGTSPMFSPRRHRSMLQKLELSKSDPNIILSYQTDSTGPVMVDVFIMLQH